MNKKYKNKMQLEILSKSSNEAFARITVAAFAQTLLFMVTKIKMG